MRMEVSQDGFTKIEQEVADIQELTIQGMMGQRPEKEILKEINSKVYRLRETLHEKVFINPAAGSPEGPDAA